MFSAPVRPASRVEGTGPHERLAPSVVGGDRAVPLLVGTALLGVFETRAEVARQDRGRRAAAAGATLVTEGEPGSNAFVILQGKCRVTRNGRRVGQVEAGGIVGELSMLNRAPRNATVVAETPLEVAIIGRKEFLALLDSSPSIRHKLLTSLAARVQELDARAPA